MPNRVENIVRKGEIACYKMSYDVFHSYISLVLQNAVLCGNGLSKDLVALRTKHLNFSWAWVCAGYCKAQILYCRNTGHRWICESYLWYDVKNFDRCVNRPTNQPTNQPINKQPTSLFKFVAIFYLDTLLSKQSHI